jgi:alkylation response protein AidB-like acyl-CoA dehydrogenase
MDVLLSEHQELLRQSARDFLERECPMDWVRSVIDDPRGDIEERWKQMAELGWTGLLIPEAQGGAGLGAIELAVLFEEAGRALLPGPLLSHVALGSVAIDLAGSDEQRKRLLPTLIEGSTRVTLALLEPAGSWSGPGVCLEAARQGDGLRLSGSKIHVPDAHLADWLIVPARAPNGDLSLCRVDRARAGVEIRPFPYVDPTRRMCEVRLRDVTVPRDDILGGAGSRDAALERILDVARVALAAELSGAAQRALDMSVQYARTREQFGRPIGSFQAIAHKCADMFVRVESSRSAAYYAAWAVASNEPDAHSSACLAKAYCSEAAAYVAGENIQVHGGLGFTWDQDPQLYFRRAKAAEHFLGDAAWNRELAARSFLDGA